MCVAGTIGINGCTDEVDPNATDEVEITVLNENDEPVAGAEVRVEGLRTKKESASGYGNRLQTAGKTNETGVATVKYPRYVLEEMETGHLILTVTHPEYSLKNIQSYDLESMDVIRLKSGRRLTVNAIDSTSGDRITQGLHAMLPGRAESEVWTNNNDGTLVSPAIDRETPCLLLVCLQQGKPTLFSDLIDLSKFDGDEVQLDKIPLSPGKRVTGRLSDNVTAPVENGEVSLCVSMAPDVVSSSDTCIMWYDFTTIAADGTFEFESIPRDADFQLTAITDGWVSVSADPDSVLKRFHYVTTPQHAENMHNTITVSQSFLPDTPQPLIVEMEQTATCHFLVVDADDQPVADAQIFMSPNNANSPGPGGIVGYFHRTAASLGLTQEELQKRGLMELVEASDRNSQQLLSILEKQLEAGQTTAADVAIVRVDAASTRQQLRLASANYQSALRDLARQCGVSPEHVPGVRGDLRNMEWTLPGVSAASQRASDIGFETAVADAASHIISWAASRPDVMAARSDIDLARANLSLASASMTPDLQIGPYYQTTADSTHFVGLRGQIDLPVINNGTPLECQRTAEHQQRVTAWQQARRRAELDAEAALARYETALRAAATATTSADLPAELEGLEAQFRAGEVDVVRVVQARTSLIQNQRASLDLLNEVAQSAATLTAAAGLPVDQLVRAAREESTSE